MIWFVHRISGWWFGCHEFYFPRNIGNLIIQIDSYFSEGWPNHQPDFIGDVQVFLNLVSREFQLKSEETLRVTGPFHAYLAPSAPGMALFFFVLGGALPMKISENLDLF